MPALERTGQGLLPFFPLASGLLTGKYRRDQPAPEGSKLAKMPDRLAGADFDTIEALGAFADERGLSMLQVAIGGLAGAVTGLVGDRRRDVRRTRSAPTWRRASGPRRRTTSRCSAT